MDCFICKENFNDIDLLINHLRIFHQLVDESNFQCPDCLKWFGAVHSYKRHVAQKMLLPYNKYFKIHLFYL